MSESYIQKLFAERIGGKGFGKENVLYKFEKIKRAKRDAMQKHPGVPLIDLGVGEPDAMADAAIVQVLSEEAKKWENRDYADNGIAEFKIACKNYMKNVFSVDHLDHENEINHSIGSKPALAMMAQAFINPGDTALITVPGYPVLATMTKWLGGNVFELPLKEENHFLPDLKSIPKDILKKAKLLYINYPNNPTGATATKKFYEEAVAFAKKNNIIIVQDAAYAALTFDGAPLSFMSVPGAKEVGVEIHSLSKAFNMTGWRLAFVCGNELVVKAFAAVKDNNDSGQFKAIQHAGVYALNHPEITTLTVEKYKRRHQMLAEVLNEIGFKVKPPKASFYLYAKIPKGIKNGLSFQSAEQFSDYLIREKLISTVPWDDVSSYVRFSVTYAAFGVEEEKQVMEEIAKRLSDVKFVF